jgi:hypothetical protein
MKKITLVTLLSLSFMGCKKDVQAPTPPPAGPCHCGEILQTDMNNKTVTAKNYCSGTILTFYVGATWFTTAHADYCRTLEW